MSKANAYLLNSLMWNLREITNLIKTIRNKVGDIKCSSWRHPLLFCGELDVLQLLEDNRDCDRYIYLLELTFDRLIYILNLIVKYMESFDSLAKFKPCKNTERPKNLSMSSILCMIWDRVQAQCEAPKESIKIRQVKDGMNSSFTQSDITSISKCSTCELAQYLVTQIVLKMENFYGDDDSSSALLTQRKLMKEKLVTMSSWSAMMTWVNAVLKDLSNIFEEIHKFKADNKKLRNRIDSSESSLMSKLRKYEEETKNLQKFCKEDDEKINKLNKELKIVLEEKSKQEDELHELRRKNSQLVKNLIDLESIRKTLEEKLIMKDRMEVERNLENKVTLDIEIEKRKSAEKELANQQALSALMEAKVAEANSKSSLLQCKIEQSMEKIKLLQEENMRLHSSLNEKQKEVDNFSNKLLEAFPDITESKHKYKGTGDPLTDMSHQIEANKLRISQLTLQNENLTQTINRIEAMRK